MTPATTAAPPEAAPKPAAPALATRVKLTKTLQLLQGSRKVVIAGSGEWFGIERAGFAPDPGLSKRIGALRSGDDEGDLLLGQAPVIAKGNEKSAKHVRVGATDQKVTVAGKLVRLAAIGDDREAWVTMTTAGNRLHVVGANGAAKALTIPRAAGPSVEGLSALGAAVCSVPVVQRLDKTDDGFVALVVECHREAPIHVARYRGPNLSFVDERRPPLGFEATDFAVHPDGRVAVLGISAGAVQFVRSGEVGSWSTTKTDVKAEHILHAVMSDDGAIWMLTSRRDKGSDIWELTRDGALVALSSEGGEPVKVVELGVDRNAGVVARGRSSDGEWLFLERKLEKTTASLP